MSSSDAETLARIREIAERAAREATPGEPEPLPTAEPLVHWQERVEDRAALSLEAGDLAARETACARLRTLLGDRAWHSALELVDVAGLRYGGRLFELRRGLDGGPALDVEGEARAHGNRTVWWYRIAPGGER